MIKWIRTSSLSLKNSLYEDLRLVDAAQLPREREAQLFLAGGCGVAQIGVAAGSVSLAASRPCIPSPLHCTGGWALRPDAPLSQGEHLTWREVAALLHGRGRVRRAERQPPRSLSLCVYTSICIYIYIYTHILHIHTRRRELTINPRHRRSVGS